MAFRMPSFIFLHAGAAAGVAAITMSPAAAAGFPAYRSIDFRGQSLAKHGSSSSSAYWQVDRGAGTLEAIDRLVIPSGHNLGAQTVTVKASATGSFGGEETTLHSFTSAAGLIVEALTSSTARYIRVGFGGTGTWEYGEIWLGRIRTPTSACALEHGWEWPKRSNVDAITFPSGATGSTVLGPDLQTGRLPFKWAQSAVDAVLFRELQAAAGGFKRPIVVLGPDDTLPTIIAFVSGDLEPFRQDSPNPVGTGPTYSLTVNLREHIG